MSQLWTFAELRSHDRDLAALIESHADCPDTAAFFVARDGARSIAIPTGLILRAFYTPTGSYLAAYLEAPERPRNYASPDVFFTGFKYTSNLQERIYPFRVARFIARAEHEISQLLPRAAAHYQTTGTTPILIRPPFLGAVQLNGRGIEKKTRSRDLAVILSDLTALTPLASKLANLAHERKHRSTRADSFAPQFGRDFVYLPLIDAYYQGKTGLDRRHSFDACRETADASIPAWANRAK